jgi:hypothetical protein
LKRPSIRTREAVEGFASTVLLYGSERATADGEGGLRPVVPLVGRAKQGFGLILTSLLLALFIAAPESSEGAQVAKKQAVLATQTASFGPVNPARLGAPVSVMMPFGRKIRSA